MNNPPPFLKLTFTKNPHRIVECPVKPQKPEDKLKNLRIVYGFFTQFYDF